MILFPLYAVCQYGYIPRSVDTEPIIQNPCTNIIFGIPAYSTILSYHYFTCCPPDLILLPLDDNDDNDDDDDDDDDVHVTSRHCTKSPTILPLNAADVIEEKTYLIANNITNKICNDIIIDHNISVKRQIIVHAVRLSVVCCDSIIIEQTSFLDETRLCNHFRTHFFSLSWALNLYGKIIPMIWSNKDLYSEFQFPRKVEKKQTHMVVSNIMNIVKQDL